MTLLHYFYRNTTCRIWTLQWTSDYKLPISSLHLTKGQTEEHALKKLLECSCFTISYQLHVHVCVLSCLSRVQPFVTLWTVAHQVPLSLGFSGQEYWSGLPCPSSRGSSPPRDRIRISCNGRWVLYLECHLGSPHVYTHIPSFLEFLPLYVPTEHWVELPVLYSRFSLVIYLSTVSVVYSQSFPEPRIGWKCRPLGWKDATPAVCPGGRMCARCSCITRHRVRPLSRGRDGCRCGPGPGLLLAASFLPHALSFVLDIPSLVWTHALLSAPLRGPLSAAQTLVSPPAGRSLRPVRFVSSHLREAAVVCASSPLFVILSLPPPVTTFRLPSVFSVLSVSNFWSQNPFKIEDPKEFFIYESCICGVLIY